MHFLLYLCTRFRNGTLPERLGIGLQNRGRRFESARYLKKEPLNRVALFLDYEAHKIYGAHGSLWDLYRYK